MDLRVPGSVVDVHRQKVVGVKHDALIKNEPDPILSDWLELGFGRLKFGEIDSRFTRCGIRNFDRLRRRELRKVVGLRRLHGTTQHNGQRKNGCPYLHGLPPRVGQWLSRVRARPQSPERRDRVGVVCRKVDFGPPRSSGRRVQITKSVPPRRLQFCFRRMQAVLLVQIDYIAARNLRCSLASKPAITIEAGACKRRYIAEHG